MILNQRDSEKIQDLKLGLSHIEATIRWLYIMESGVRELLAKEYILASGKSVHSQSCATSVSPDEGEPGECDCDAK